MKKDKLTKLRRKLRKKMSIVQRRKRNRKCLFHCRSIDFGKKLAQAIEFNKLACGFAHSEPQKAIDLFKKAIDFAPFFSAPYNSLAVVVSNQGEHEVALEYAKKAVLFAPAHYGYLNTYWKIVNRAWDAIGNEAIASKKLAKYTDYFEQEFTNDRMSLKLVTDQDILIRAMPELEFVERLQKTGEMYFKPTNEFRTLPDTNPRKDANENKPLVHELLPFDKETRVTDDVLDLSSGPLSIKIDARGGSVVTKGLSIKIGGQESVYCFSLLSRSNFNLFMEHYEWDKLGEYALVINNITEFRDRVRTGLSQAGKARYQEGLVSYMPPRFLDNIRALYLPYIKSTQYQREFEYRVSCSTSGKAESIYIGSLEGISEIVPVKDLKEYLQGVMKKRHGNTFA